MPRAPRCTPLLVAALVAGSLSGLPAAWGQGQTAERPTLDVGATWARDDGTWSLARVERDAYVFAGKRGDEIHLGRDLGVMKVVRGGVVELELDTPLGPGWPLQVGRWGTSRVTVLRSGHRYGGNAPVEHTWRVAGQEEVSTPAGTFRAFRIEHAVESYGFGAVGRTSWWGFTTWYAPERGQLVRGEGTMPGMTFQVVAPALPMAAAPPAVAAPAPAPAPVPAPPAVALRSPAPAKPPPAPAASRATAAPPPAVVAAPPPPDRGGPRITINYPPADAKVDREQIMVLALITASAAIERVQVTVNGVEVPQPHPAGEPRGVPVRVPAPLLPGENVVEITASDRAGGVAQAVRTVTRLAPAPAGPPPPRIASRWAVVIGVGQYEHGAIPPLRYATRDAEAVYRFLTTKGGYAKDNVLLLTDSTEQKPTLQNIRRALGDFLYRKPGRDDMVLIYYAGHGAPEVDATGTEGDGITKYLIPRNADPESLYSSALPMDEIQRIFSRIQSERVVLLLDTCYSGTAGGRTFARQQMRSGSLNEQFLERLTRSKGRVIITAAGPNEVALETSELGHGVFTYYLLQGLGGEADRDTDGLVTVSELYEYVEQQVDRKARAAGGRQRPLMKGEIEGALPLARVGR